jgi:outer membrane protein
MPFFSEHSMQRALLVCLALAATPVLAQNPPPVRPNTGAAAQPAPSQPRGFKVAYISSQEILQATPGYAAAESTFTKEVQGFRDELQRLQQQLDSAVATLDQQSIALSPAAKQAKQRDLQQQQQRITQRQEELQQRAQQRQQELLQPIQDRIRAVIEGIRAEDNYALVFDVAAPGSSVVAWDPSLNITAKVIQRLTHTGTN